jgi:glycosyltransferase involved in cell wall biosynthesis
MHVALNATEIGRQRGGNESFLLGLLEGWRLLPEAEPLSLIVCADGLTQLAALPHPAWSHVIDTGVYRRWPSYLWQQTRALQRLQPDWYLSTFLLPPRVPCRAAVIVHDVSFRAHPEYFPASIAAYMRVLVGWAVHRAEVVLTISEFTRRELQHYYPAARDKTTVVSCGVSSEFTAVRDAEADRELLTYGIEAPYLLAVGNIHPRKNLNRLLDAYLQLRQTMPDAPQLVWAGVERWGSTALQQQARSAGVHLPGRIAPEHLPALYRQAVALIYPSVYEGFGLPPIEAMACGTPVIASNTTSMPEVVGDAALLVDPFRVDDLAQALKRVVSDAALRAELRARGLTQAKQYRWEAVAERVWRALSGGTARSARPADRHAHAGNDVRISGTIDPPRARSDRCAVGTELIGRADGNSRRGTTRSYLSAAIRHRQVRCVPSHQTR